MLLSLSKLFTPKKPKTEMPLLSLTINNTTNASSSASYSAKEDKIKREFYSRIKV